MTQKFIEELIETDNRIAEKLDSKYPLFYKLRKKVISNRRFGFKLLDDDGKVTEEYTILVGEPYIKGYEEGIKDVWFTKGVKLSLIEEIIEKEEEFTEKPWRTFLKYMVKSPKYFIDKDVTLSRE